MQAKKAADRLMQAKRKPADRQAKRKAADRIMQAKRKAARDSCKLN